MPLGAKYGGRQKGTLNKATIEAREFARHFLRSSEYSTSVERRILLDELPAGVEVALWHYAFGKPTETVEVAITGVSGLTELSAADLAAEATLVSTQILQLKANAEAMEAEVVVDQDHGEESR